LDDGLTRCRAELRLLSDRDLARHRGQLVTGERKASYPKRSSYSNDGSIADGLVSAGRCIK